MNLNLPTAVVDQILSILQEVNLPHKITNPIIQMIVAQANDPTLNPKEDSNEPA
jgi:hypothetical protein